MAEKELLELAETTISDLAKLVLILSVRNEKEAVKLLKETVNTIIDSCSKVQLKIIM